MIFFCVKRDSRKRTVFERQESERDSIIENLRRQLQKSNERERVLTTEVRSLVRSFSLSLSPHTRLIVSLLEIPEQFTKPSRDFFTRYDLVGFDCILISSPQVAALRAELLQAETHNSPAADRLAPSQVHEATQTADVCELVPLCHKNCSGQALMNCSQTLDANTNRLAETTCDLNGTAARGMFVAKSPI